MSKADEAYAAAIGFDRAVRENWDDTRNAIAAEWVAAGKKEQLGYELADRLLRARWWAQRELLWAEARVQQALEGKLPHSAMMH